MNPVRRLWLRQEQDYDWVGSHLTPVELDGPGSGAVAGAGVRCITVQLTDPARGDTTVLVRGSARVSQARLMAILKQEV